jgi:O-antigen ligase
MEELMGVEATDPHNVWLGMAAEQGIVGLVTYILFFFAIIKLATSKLRSRLSGLPRSLCSAYLGYFVFWLTMSYSVFFKGTGHIHFMLIGLMLGLGQSLLSQRTLERSSILATGKRQ